MTELKHITFFIDGPLDKFDLVEKLVKESSAEFYLISHELLNAKGENKPHYHFIILSNEKTFNALFKRLKSNLNAVVTTKGRGGYRPYGRLKEPIRDIEKLKIYCCKDGNVRSTYSTAILEELHQKSFKKNSEDRLFNGLKDFLNQKTLSQNQIEFIDEIRRGIIEYLISKDEKISKPKIEGYLSKYIRTSDWDTDKKLDIFMGLYYKIYI